MPSRRGEAEITVERQRQLRQVDGGQRLERRLGRRRAVKRSLLQFGHQRLRLDADGRRERTLLLLLLLLLLLFLLLL